MNISSQGRRRHVLIEGLEIQKCYGSDMTEVALQHRFRPLKTQAQIVRLGLQVGLDPAGLTHEDSALPRDQNKIDKDSMPAWNRLPPILSSPTLVFRLGSRPVLTSSQTSASILGRVPPT